MRELFLKLKEKDFSSYYPLLFTAVFIFVLFQYSFSNIESVFYDFRVRHDFGFPFQDNIVLVVLDEESDEFLGESYPYTYASHTHALERITADGPSALGYLIDFQEPLNDLEFSQYEKFQSRIEKLQEKEIRFRFGTSMDAWGEHRPPNDLQRFGYSLALINVDNSIFAKDNVNRRAILNISGEDSFHLWMASEYRKSKGADELAANQYQGAYYLKDADATFSLYRFYANTITPESKITRIPFHKVRVGNFPKGYFKDKIVLVGSSYVSNLDDYLLTPFNEEDDYTSSNLNVHAAIIQSFIHGKTVYQVPKGVSYALSIILAIVLSVVISNLKPTKGLVMTLLMMFGVIVTAYMLFILFGLWLYVTHMILTIFVVYYIWVPFRAIGEYQRRFAIEEEAKLIQKVENLKQNFISLMSHDLKTPVAKIAGLADIMLYQRQFHSSDGEKNLRSIVDATGDLNRFITSILDLTKVESRNLTLNLTSRDINKTIIEVIDNLKYEANSKSVKVEESLGPLYPIKYDLNLMNRVISNLLENAIKYSGEGSLVEIESWDDEKWVYIKIRDNGAGIPESEVENIFEKFYRVKNDTSHKVKGTGLGLYLVKYFVELHGGKISVSSSLGEGTTFQIMLVNE